MQDVYAVMTKVVEGERQRLSRGGNGTGKELIAETLHARGHGAPAPSSRSTARPSPKPRWIGNSPARPRRVTLFLDAIGELTPYLQARLLHVIRTGPQVRVIAATNRDLRQAVHTGHFRGTSITASRSFTSSCRPSERTEDIPMLVAHFLRRKRPGTGRRSAA